MADRRDLITWPKAFFIPFRYLHASERITALGAGADKGIVNGPNFINVSNALTISYPRDASGPTVHVPVLPISAVGMTFGDRLILSAVLDQPFQVTIGLRGEPDATLIASTNWIDSGVVAANTLFAIEGRRIPGDSIEPRIRNTGASPASGWWYIATGPP